MTSKLSGLLTLIHALEWQVSSSTLDKATAQALTKGTFGDPVKLATGQLEFKVAAAPEETHLERMKRELDKKKKVDGHQTSTVLGAWLPAMKERIEAERFLHWQVAFPGIWRQWESAELHGGFDAVIGNPPYVRHELLGTIKPALRRAYPASYDGYADLYVYFYEQGLKLLRPGGRLSYVVTNKWMRAGYAEGLRGLFAEKAWVEFVADFGHAKNFFPDADVFPSVLVVRKPNRDAGPAETQVCVIPRDDVPKKGLDEAVANATYPLPRTHFSKEIWTLEPTAVVALLQKISKSGKPLGEYSSAKIYRGVTTGLNEAFLIDTATRNQLIAACPACKQIIKPYLPGQDIERWSSRWNDSWMIFARRGIDIDFYPSIKAHLEKYREQLEPKPDEWKPQHERDEWNGRKPGQYKWFEIQDSTDYWAAFEQPKIIYQEIAWKQTFQIDRRGRFLPNTAYMIGEVDPWLLCVLNSPTMWWWSWRKAVHGKDEALRFIKDFILTVPVPGALVKAPDTRKLVEDLENRTTAASDGHLAIMDWLRLEFGIEKLKKALKVPLALERDAFVAAVRANLPKRHRLSAADIAELKREHAATIEPARKARAEILALERKLSNLVNDAYGLTPEEVRLMWETAPPRMPFTRAGLGPSDTEINSDTVDNNE